MCRIKTAVVIFVILILLFVYLGVAYFDAISAWIKSSDGSSEEIIAPSASVEQNFKKFSVCTDAPPCSTVGKDILEKNGSAVDAAIASMLCNGIYNAHSTGIGGGFQMLVYSRETRNISILDAREVAPLLSNKTMFENQTGKSRSGALASGVPGEMAGYWEAWSSFGKLKWAELFAPALEMCETGYKISQSQVDAFTFNETSFRRNVFLVDQFVDPETNKFKPVGTLVTPNQKLCETLKIVAEETPKVFYNGRLGQAFVEDVQSMGGIITMEDLNKYSVEWRDPVKVTLHNNETVFSTPPPGNGLLLVHILKIMDKYRLSAADLKNRDARIKTFHRIIEAFKFAFAKRTKLGDPKFINVTQLLTDLQSDEYANETFHQIRDDKTFDDPQHYGATLASKDDSGTAHISILAPNGDAVSVTSTVNLYFGAQVTSSQTGILLNSGMDDFSTPGLINYFKLPPVPTNFIEPGKRSISSTSPSIIVSDNGDVRMVIGASGGTKIPTALAQVIMRHLWMDLGIKAAIDAPRLHHQLIPMNVTYEEGISAEILKGLEALGHVMEKRPYRGSVVCAIVRLGDDIAANADYKKKGIAAGA
ncbi:glutathione hydrolase 1 proenzyme isoform X2 [Bemisia tabaci]